MPRLRAPLWPRRRFPGPPTLRSRTALGPGLTVGEAPRSAARRFCIRPGSAVGTAARNAFLTRGILPLGASPWRMLSQIGENLEVFAADFRVRAPENCQIGANLRGVGC